MIYIYIYIYRERERERERKCDKSMYQAVIVCFNGLEARKKLMKRK